MARVGLLLASALVASLVLKVKAFNESHYKQIYPPQGEEVNGTEPLYIAFLISFGGDYTSSGALPGVQVALDQINADPSILPGYTLHYTLRDSNCHRTTALDSLFIQLREEPTKIGMIGAGCSVATEATAEVSHYYNITQISCLSSSHELSNRVKFPLYFQVLASEATLAGGFYGIVREFGWRNVAIITQNENLFTVTMDRLKGFLMANGINYTETRFLSEEGVAGLGQQPFEQGKRIFIVAMYNYHARFLMCQAFKQGIRYPRYLFLLYGWYADNWWVGSPEDDMLYGCTAEERQSVLPYSLAPLTSEFISDNSAVADTGYNGSAFEEAYDEHLRQAEFDLSPLIYRQNCYDATWTMAKALHNSMQELNDLEGSGNLSLTDQLSEFTYSNSRLKNIIFENLRKTNFTGITGPLRFGEDGVRRVKNLIVFQYQEREAGEIEVLTIARVIENVESGQFDFVSTSSAGNLTWRDGLVPYDGVPVEEEVHASLALAVIIYILAAAGVVFAIICLVFNFVFRERKLIRLSSPNLNYLIGAGAIILYIDICFFPVPSTDPAVVSVACNLTAWLTALGYSLCYGTIVVKICRTYYHFHDPMEKKKNVKDWTLILAVMLLCVVDLIILVVYTAVEGARGNLEAERVVSIEKPMEIRGELEIIYQFYVYICDSQARDIFLGILYGYKAALQIVALVLSFGIRKVKVKGLDDSKYIAAAVYVTSIVLAVVIVATYTLNHYVYGFPALVSIGFFIGTTVILILVFIPRIVGLYQDPRGEDEEADSSQRRNSNVSSLGQLKDDGKTIKITKVEFEELKKRVKNLEIAQLTSGTYEDPGFPPIPKKNETEGRRPRRVSFVDELPEGQVPP